MPDLASLIMNQARKTGADPYTLLATAMVESGLNPRAVGDGGTSYGLFQFHVGGAGGPTHASARKYLDPMTAVENRARHFRGGSGGAFAASVQRPADAAGYARKVDAVIAQLKAGKMPKGSNVQLNAPVASQGVSGGSNKAAAIGLIFGDDPVFNMAAQSAASAKPSVQGPVVQTGAGVPARLPGEKGWQYLQRIGSSMFGLKNDPGNSQSTGGKHTAGSNHYKGKAIDFGNGRNSEAQLNKFHSYLNQNRGALGVDELIWKAPGHYDHLHASTLKSKRPSKLGVLKGTGA